MDIDLSEFSAPQQQAFFELLILAMYADGHLATVEDEFLQKLLESMGYKEPFERQRELDAAVTQIRPCIQSLAKAKELALSLADGFTTRQQQRKVYAAVERMMASDGHVTVWEGMLLSELRLKFRV